MKPRMEINDEPDESAADPDFYDEGDGDFSDDFDGGWCQDVIVSS